MPRMCIPNSGDNVCPLCHGTGIAAYHADKTRNYLHCHTCDLVFVPRGQHLSAGEEKAYYDLHENQPDDPGYRRFLDRLFTPLNQRLPGRELDQLWDRLAPGGWLSIMTKRVRDQGAFKTWHYITDPTHISYFSEASFHWLAAHWSGMGPAATLTIAGNDVVLINKAGE
mgnify:CR=1 FL=1